MNGPTSGCWYNTSQARPVGFSCHLLKHLYHHKDCLANTSNTSNWCHGARGRFSQDLAGFVIDAESSLETVTT